MASISPSEYEWVLNRSFWPIDGTQTNTSTPGPNQPGSNGNERVVHTYQISGTLTSLYTPSPVSIF